MTEPDKSPSQCLYQIVAVRIDRSRTVMMKGLELQAAVEARNEMSKDDQEFVWFIVERETE